MARNIGIVGAGIAGLHLALYLQKHGVDATIITDRPPEDYRGHSPAQHRRASPRDDRARGLSRRQSLDRSEGPLLLPRPRLQFSAAAELPRRFLEGEPRRRLPDLSPGPDAGFYEARRQDRISPHRGARHPSAGRALRSAGRLDRQGTARPALHLPARAHALFAAATAPVRRALHRRAAARSR